MAPMAGITTPPFRRSVRRWGAGLVFTEMISAYGVHYRNRRTLDYLVCGADEHPLGFQLFGADADVLADAAARCVEAGADLVDLNMACPVRKVVKTGAGAALLGDPDRAAAIVAAVVGAVDGPSAGDRQDPLRAARGRRGGAPHWPPGSSPPAPRPCASTRGRQASCTAGAPTTPSRSLWRRSCPSP